jgi:RimJ/RimL family protein N-acetyltransferase
VESLQLPDPPLTDGVVTLRGWRESDVQDLFAACQDPEIPRWTITIPSPYLVGHARDWVARQPDFLRGGEAAHFAITDCDTGRLLGGIGLELHPDGGHPEIGYWLAGDARGRGAATRATRLVADWGLRALGLDAIGLRTHAENRASRGVARRAGFVPAGTVAGRDRHGVAREFLFFTRSAAESGEAASTGG